MGKRQTNRLTVLEIRNKKQAGYYADGNGLYLQVSTGGAKSWILRFSLNKRAREMGLGSTSDWTLSEVREQARKHRQMLDEGIDPIAHREAERQRNLQAVMQRRTFEQCAHEYHKLHASGWKNVKHADQWINTLTAYAFPIFGKRTYQTCRKPTFCGRLSRSGRRSRKQLPAFANVYGPCLIGRMRVTIA